MESQIERVLILADKPVMNALFPRPRCSMHCAEGLPVRQRAVRAGAKVSGALHHTTDIAYASVGAAASTGKGAPNDCYPKQVRHGGRQSLECAGQVYWQPSDYLLVGLGANAYQGKTDFTGSLVSFGFDFAQLDIGFRPHWFSPLSDSSLLMSTEAPTMPSVTLSNYRPLTRLGLHYELFAARMSKSEHIQFRDGFTVGHPRLVGFHVDMEPASGWSLGLSRVLQYGGGARNTNSLRDVFDAFFNPSKFDNTSLFADQRPAGRQPASLLDQQLPVPGQSAVRGVLRVRGRRHLPREELSAG